MTRYLSADPQEGSPTPDPAEPAPPLPAPAPPVPAQPVAAQIVVTGTKSEREIELEAELDKERQAHATTATEKKAHEQRINELEDERRRLMDPPRPAPVPRSAPKSKRTRLTFFDDGGD